MLRKIALNSFVNPYFLTENLIQRGGEQWLVKEEGDCSGERTANTSFIYQKT